MKTIPSSPATPFTPGRKGFFDGTLRKRTPRELPAGRWKLGWIFALMAGVAAGEDPESVCAPVDSFSLAPPRILWHDAANCIPAGRDFPAINDDEPEVISRVASTGSLPREIFHENPPRPDGVCNPYEVLSNVAADAEHVHWVDGTGLVRLPVTANPGDPPELVSGAIGGSAAEPTELVAGSGTELYARVIDGGSSRIYRIDKQAGATPELLANLTGITTGLSSDGKYLYYLRSGVLWRLEQGRAGITVKQLDTDVTGYHAEGRRLLLPSGATEYVWIAKDRSIYRFDNVTDTTTGALYTSSDPTGVVYSLTSIGGGLAIFDQPAGVFFFERRTESSGLFNFYNQLLFRIPRGGGAGENLYFRNGTVPVTVDADHLTDDGRWLYWKDGEQVLRLSADAGALAMTNMRITDIEVTQTIQDLDNSVPLIAGKRTFVRLHVRSDDPSSSVPSVYANLTATWDGGSGGPLNPINPGVKITVHPNPDRGDIDQSFLFELPIQWTHQSNLRIFGHLNPFHLPLQESYANNESGVGPLDFLESPRMELELFAFQHEVDGTDYEPDYEDDVLPTLSWIRRAYPLAGGAGGLDAAGSGLRARVTYLFDAGLGSRVARTHPSCLLMPEDRRSLCAANYVNAKLAAWRTVLGTGTFAYYGLMRSGPEFPRGRKGSTGVACGPAAPPGSGSWDMDSTIADWYTAHELGHVYGRGHPFPNSDDPATEDISEGCGHSRSDLAFPYAGARIGPFAGDLMGFDSGSMSVPRAVLPASMWTDMMGYCDFQWISDYTYEGIFSRLTFINLSLATSGAPGSPALEGGVVGPWLTLFGTIHPSAMTALVPYLRVEQMVASVPPGGRGDYRVELIDESGGILEAAEFQPEPATGDGQSLPFGVVLPWRETTRWIRIRDARDDRLVFERAVSPTAPAVSHARVPDAGGVPLSGIHAVEWNAMDAEGDPLTFDLLGSHDGGVTFRPIASALSGSAFDLDFGRLGGGEVIFRLIGSDGVRCGLSDTEPVDVSLKPPVPVITSPSDGLSVEYGHLLTFAGQADDLQDGGIPAEQLVWEGLEPSLAVGDLISTDTLPVGENLVTLTATNSAGLSASTSIIVNVTDELTDPPGRLSVTPHQVGWEVRTGGPAPSPLILKLAAVGGGGIIDWTAGENADWLMLSATAGSTPADLMLFADPAHLEPGRAYRANVTLTSTANPPQEVVIPVTLSLDVSSFAGPLGPLGAYPDADLDCLPDWWEALYAESRPMEADAEADGDMDGATDFYEYATGTNPTTADAADGLPGFQLLSNGNGQEFFFTYRRRINEPSLDYVVEVSRDLQVWDSGPGFTQEVNSVAIDGNLEEVAVRILLQASGEEPAARHFARLRVVKNGP